MAHLLVHAALAPIDQARASFLQWWTHPDTESSSERLLPLLYARLGRLDLPVAAHQRLKEAYRRSLRHGQMRRLRFLHLTRNEGWPLLPWLVLKGAALSELYFPSWAERPMGDVDVLIHKTDLVQWQRALRQLGFRGYESYPHSEAFHHPAGQELDVHWCALSECLWPGVDDDLWRLSQVRTVDDVEWRVLCPAHQLLHLCAHGSKHDGRHSPWLVDSAQVVRQEPELDWDELWRAAERRRLTPAVSLALRELAPYASVPPPKSRGSWWDRSYAHLRALPPGRGRHLLVDALHYARQKPKTGWLGYINHLRVRWGARTWSGFLAVLLARGLRELSLGPRTPGWLPGLMLAPGQEERLRLALSGADSNQTHWLSYRRAVHETLHLLRSCSPGVARGPRLAERYYPEPWLRDCRDLDLTVDGSCLASAEELLAGGGYVRRALGRWIHSQGLEVQLHSSLLADACFAFPQDGWIESDVCDVPVRVLEGPELLAFLVGRASQQKVPLQWVTDFAMVWREHGNQWICVPPILERAGLALTSAAVIGDLERILMVSLPAKPPAVPSQADWEASWRAALRRGCSIGNLLSGVGNWEVAMRYLWWLIKRESLQDKAAFSLSSE